MPYDRNAFVDKIHEIYTKKKSIADLTAQRIIAEQAIATEYKVDECNAARATLVSDTQKVINPIMDEIKILETALLEM